MIKGVNRKIVEINRTGNDYFEKAILLINPQKSYSSTQQIYQWAEEYLDSMLESGSKQNRLKKWCQKHSVWKWGIIFLTGLLLGCGIMLLFF